MKFLHLSILLSLYLIFNSILGVSSQTCPQICFQNYCQESFCNATSNYQCQTYPKNCDDNRACTSDSCDLTLGCVHTLIDCNGTDLCYNYYCDDKAGCFGLNKCYDGKLCTQDSCDSSTGACSFTPLMCDDGDACTSDFCEETVGCIHLPLNCDDGHSCTTDSCSKTTGCIHTPIDDCVECSGLNLPCVSTQDKCSPSVCDPMNPGQCVVRSINCTQSNPCISTYCESSTGNCIFSWICETPQPTETITHSPSQTPPPTHSPNTLATTIATTTATTTSHVTTAGTTGRLTTTASTVASYITTIASTSGTLATTIATTTSHITRPPRPDGARPSDLLRGCLSCEDLNCHSEVSNDGNRASCIYVRNDINFDEDDCSDCCKWIPTCSFNLDYPQQYY